MSLGTRLHEVLLYLCSIFCSRSQVRLSTATYRVRSAAAPHFVSRNLKSGRVIAWKAIITVVAAGLKGSGCWCEAVCLRRILLESNFRALSKNALVYYFDFTPTLWSIPSRQHISDNNNNNKGLTRSWANARQEDRNGEKCTEMHGYSPVDSCVAVRAI